MEDFWARVVEPSGQPGPDYWTAFAQRLADLAAVPEGAAVLDIGTFDGNVLFKAMPGAGPHGLGVGIDIYAGALPDSRALARQRGPGNAVFAQMDADSLGFRSEIYDAVLANFVGWDDCFDFHRLEFTAPDRRLAEVRRVLQPGGRVGIGFWIEQADIDWIVEAFRRYLPEREEASGQQMLSYGVDNPEGYEAILDNGGFRDVRIHTETTTVVSPDTATWWRQMKQAASDYFEAMPEFEEFREQVLADLRPFQSARGILFAKTVGYAFGSKR